MPHPVGSVRDERRRVVDAMIPSGHLDIRLVQPKRRNAERMLLNTIRGALEEFV